jgi:hypothetical protein
MENNSFRQRVIEAANSRTDKVAMTLIGPAGAETTTFGELLSQIRSVAYRLMRAGRDVDIGIQLGARGQVPPHNLINLCPIGERQLAIAAQLRLILYLEIHFSSSFSAVNLPLACC